MNGEFMSGFTEMPSRPENREFVDLFKNIAGSRGGNFAEKLEDSLKGAKIREVFLAFAEQNPHLISSSPLFNKAATNITSSFYTESELGRLKILASKIYIWATGRFSKPLETFERMILLCSGSGSGNLSSLCRYLHTERNSALISQELRLLFSYVEAGIFDLGRFPLATILSNYRNPYFKDPANVEAALPVFNLLASHRHGYAILQQIFSIQNQEGCLITQYAENFKILLPWFEKLTTSANGQYLLISLLSLQNQSGLVFSAFQKIVELLLPLFEKLATSEQRQDQDLLVKILSIQGINWISSKLSFEALLPLFERLATSASGQELLIKILSIQGQSGYLPTMTARNFKGLLPLFEKLAISERRQDQDLLVKILSLQNSNGWTNLSLENIDVLLSLFERLATSTPRPELLVKIFSLPTQSGRTLFSNPDAFNVLLPLLNRLATSDREQSLLINVLEGINFGTKIHEEEKLLSTYLPLLLKLAESEVGKTFVHELLTKRDLDGNTLLHKNNIRSQAEALIALCHIDLESLKNNLGLVPGEGALSDSWLTKPKYAPEMREQLTSEQYKERGAILRSEVLKTWDSLKFGYGEGELSPILLDIKGKYKSAMDAGQQLTTYQIGELVAAMRSALNTMLERIAAKTPFLGTPREDQPQERHNFYKSMLINFEVVMHANKNKGELTQAGSLISISTTEIEKRCAAAYQSEIGQQADLARYAEGKMSLEMLIERSAASSFQAFIEKLVLKLHRGNVHYLNQFLYAAELVTVPDPLVRLSVREAQQIILKNFDYHTFTTDFSRSVPCLYLTNYLYSLTPDDFDEGYLAIIEEAKQGEEAVIDDTRRILVEAFLEEKIDKAIEAIRTLRGTLPSEGIDFSKDYVTQVYVNGINRFNDYLIQQELNPAPYLLPSKILNVAELEDLKDQLSEHYRGQMRMPQPPTPAAVAKWRKQRLDANNMLEAFMNEVEMATKLRGEMEPRGFNTKEQYRTIIAAHAHFVKGVTQIAQKIQAKNEKKDVDAAFDPNQDGLPSQTYDYKRRAIYNQQWLTSPLATSLKTLQAIGVLE